MKSSIENLGHTDPKNERAAQLAQKEILENIQEEIGEEAYKEIIKALLNGDVSQLTDEQKTIIEKLREEMSKPH